MQNQSVSPYHLHRSAAMVNRVTVVKLNRAQITEKKDIRSDVPYLKGIRDRGFLQRHPLRPDTHGKSEFLSGGGQITVDFASQIKATGHGGNKNRRFEPLAEERGAKIQFGDVEFGKRVVEKAVTVEARSRGASNAIGIEAEFEMLFFTLLGFRQSFLHPAWHGLAVGFLFTVV